ncbi:MAG: hypothetical protein E6344_09475 [Clostridium sp.]|nr:hypothetical protein [Clostridium sp.]MDU7083916.1 hypothetical protein [Clostridium sp.]
MKKKIIWGIIIVVSISFIIWRDIPYLVTTRNVISSKDIDYAYENISIYNFNDADGEHFQIEGEENIEDIIKKIDGLKLRRIKSYGGWGYSINFHGTYHMEERVTYTGIMYRIVVGETKDGYTLTYYPHETSKERTYKILDKEFDVDKFMEEIMEKKL